MPGLERQWWHRFVNARHQHVFALRPESDGRWTVFESWWHRLLTATVDPAQARKFLLWGARGDVLLAREEIPGRSGQLRVWMNCAVLASQLLGRNYFVWTPHGLYRRLAREPGICHVDVSVLLESDLAKLEPEGSRVVAACEACSPGAPRPPGTKKPFCLHCGRDLGGAISGKSDFS